MTDRNKNIFGWLLLGWTIPVLMLWGKMPFKVTWKWFCFWNWVVCWPRATVFKLSMK